MGMEVPTFTFLLLSCLVHIILSLPTQESLSVVEPFEKSNPIRVGEEALYEGDILWSKQQRDAKKNRKAIDSDSYRWPDGPDGSPRVPYLFQDAVNQTDVKAGLDHWVEHTCIKFEETNITDQNHIQFHIGTGCWSRLGMQFWEEKGQELSIGNNCNSLGVVVHEIGHALGFYHEQSRIDRDEYVKIIYANIKQTPNNYTSQFTKGVDNNYSVPYDFTSNMHYGENLFGIDDAVTILTKDPWNQGLIGNRKGLTHRDILLANRMYNCTGKWLSKCSISSDPCLNDGYIGKDCTCICPSGTSGSNCEEIVDDYYATARSPLSEKITTEKTITIESKLKAGIRFTKWIIPPAGKTAKVIFTYASLYTGGCQYQNLRVKTNNAETIGQTLCAEDVNIGLNFTSDTGIMIFMYNQVNYSGVKKFWEAEVSFEDTPTTDQAPTTQASGPSTSSPIEPSTPSSESSAWEKLKDVCVYIKNTFDIKIV